MTSQQDYFQCYVNSFQHSDKTVKTESGKYVILTDYKSLVFQEFHTWVKILEELELKYVTAIEVASNDKGKHKVHFQTVIQHNYVNTQTCQKKLHKSLEALKLAKKSYGFVRKDMRKTLHENIIYVLKDQSYNDKTTWASSGIDITEDMFGKWKPIEHMLTSKREQTCTSCKGSLNYCQKLQQECLAKYPHPTKYAIVEFVLERTVKDKARLPNHMIIELSRSIAYKAGLIDKDKYIRELEDKI